MATRTPAAREVRRDAFLDSAQRLIALKGYDQMTVQDVLDDLDASKGAFYHYFGAKADLLEAVVARMLVVALESVRPVVSDPELGATEKLNRVFTGIAGWKAQRRDLVLGMLRVWYSDDNALVRDKLRRGARQRLTPLLAEVIEQGRAEGVFAVASAASTAEVLVWLLEGAQDLAGELFFARQADTTTFAEVQARYSALAESIERLLGAAPGTVPLLDAAALREWFG